MHAKRIILLYLFIIISATAAYPARTFPYSTSVEPITQYIMDLSNDIYSSVQEPAPSVIYNSRGVVKLRLFLSPWGELKDAYIYESSGNEDLDNLCLKAVWLYERYQPFPEELGDDGLWVDVPIIFEVSDREEFDSTPKDERLVERYSKDKQSSMRKHAGKTTSTPSSATPDTNRIVSRSSMLAHAIYKDVLGVEGVVDLALENHMSARIAEEEIELSKLKIREARRALYPIASLNYLETTGETAAVTQDFIDREYKLKFEYPLYYGWRLKYAVDQAIANMKTSKQNYDKVLHDLRGEVESTFYSYLVAKINVKLQRSLLEEAKEIFNTAEKTFELELITNAEFQQVYSQLKQVAYQVTSSENDMDMAKLSLTQAMNIRDSVNLEDFIDINIDVLDLEPLDLEVTLERCLDIAFKYRPDLKSKEYAVEFNEYERKIAMSKDQFRLDLTGSYGKSGGAYETETLEMGKDWYLGVKLTKPLGGNTISTAYTEDQTSEKHGESSRIESTSKSVEFGILDNIQSFSEKKSSEIGLKKAMNEVQQAREVISKEVKASYLDYKKGLIQRESNVNKIRYREEELKIAKARAELHEISLSELMQAHMSLIDEKSFYIEAIGSLYQSLVQLNKATGYAMFLDSESFMLAGVE